MIRIMRSTAARSNPGGVVSIPGRSAEPRIAQNRRADPAEVHPKSYGATAQALPERRSVPILDGSPQGRQNEWRMLSLDEALARVLAARVPLEAESVAVTEAYGRVLADDVVSPLDLP